jgi:hypothetical protein
VLSDERRVCSLDNRPLSPESWIVIVNIFRLPRTNQAESSTGGPTGILGDYQTDIFLQQNRISHTIAISPPPVAAPPVRQMSNITIAAETRLIQLAENRLDSLSSEFEGNADILREGGVAIERWDFTIEQLEVAACLVTAGGHALLSISGWLRENATRRQIIEEVFVI